MTSNPIVVIGSCMIDFVSYTPHLPKPGETIHGTKFITTFGGKGANQCVAAAKLGGQTTLVARVGDDVWADKYLENLKENNIDAKYVKKTLNSTSGVAQISVAESGENQIVIVAGANNYLSRDDVVEARQIIQNCSVLILQLETSMDVALKALELCPAISILNGAPAVSTYNPELLKLPTIFCVNETEAEIFTGLTVKNLSEAKVAIKHLIDKGCKSVILTLGAQGALYLKQGGTEVLYVTCPVVQCVDSTGAGDAFIGALAYLLATVGDLPMRKILEASCYIASDSVTRRGTQISFPGQEILKNCAL